MGFPLFSKIVEELWRERLLQSGISSVRTVWPCWVNPTVFEVRVYLCPLTLIERVAAFMPGESEPWPGFRGKGDSGVPPL